MRGDRLGQDGRIGRLQQPHLAGALDAAGVDRDEHVARALVAFGAKTLDERIGLGVDAVDLDARQVGEIAVQGFVGLVVTGRIEIERPALRPGPSGDEHTGAKRQASLHERTSLHVFLRCE